MLQFMGSQRVGQDFATDHTELIFTTTVFGHIAVKCPKVGQLFLFSFFPFQSIIDCCQPYLSMETSPQNLTRALISKSKCPFVCRGFVCCVGGVVCFGCTTRRVGSGLNPCPLHWKQSLNHKTTREILFFFF